MNRNQFETLRARPVGEPTLHVKSVGSPTRTLVYGYTTDRTTFHVYVAGDDYGRGLPPREFHRVLYSGDTLIDYSHAPEMSLRDLKPNKRAYPERTDYDFARLMAAAGEPLTFLPYPDGPAPKAFADSYHGSIIGDGGVLVDVVSLVR